MVTRLTAGNKDLSELLADFRASVQAAQQQHASWTASAAKIGRQSSETSKEATTAGGSTAQPHVVVQAADETLQDLQGAVSPGPGTQPYVTSMIMQRLCDIWVVV